jgi:hypothetical protein
MRNDIAEQKELIEKLISEIRPKSYICKILKCKTETLENYLNKWGIVYKGNVGLKGYKIAPNKKSVLEYLNSDLYISASKLRRRLIKEGLKEHKCEECELKEWQGKLIPLELHHKDGNRFNNNLSNLQILCCNCHALTENYGSKNKAKNTVRIYKTDICICGLPKQKRSNQCIDCAYKKRKKMAV